MSEILKGDCINLMQSFDCESFDACITDPPYASGGKTSYQRAQDPQKKYQQSNVKRLFPSFSNDNRDQRTHYLWYLRWMDEVYRIIRPNGWIMVFTDWRQLPLTSDALQVAGFDWRGIVTWDKRIGRPKKGEFRSQCEYVVVGVKGGVDKDLDVYPSNVFSGALNIKDKVHMTQKPVELMAHLMTVLPPKSRIIDPFLGSGTTILAAENAGHEACGIEMSEEYFEIAQKRLNVA